MINLIIEQSAIPCNGIRMSTRIVFVKVRYSRQGVLRGWVVDQIWLILICMLIVTKSSISSRLVNKIPWLSEGRLFIEIPMVMILRLFLNFIRVVPWWIAV
jgi:hypothetical protein